jgi:hypothetical protein
MNTNYFNHNLDGSDIPLNVGDRYYGQDRLRDFWNQREYGKHVIEMLANTASNTKLEGLQVSQGTGHTINITQGRGIVNYQIKPPSSWGTIPPTMSNADIRLIVEVPSLADQSITSATTDGTTLNYVKLAYNEVTVQTRTRAKKAGSYDSEVQASYIITVDSTAPTSYELVISTFKTNGVTIEFINQSLNEVILSNIGWNTGDIKMGMLQVEPSGWILCTGRTIGDSGSGATLVGLTYRKLYFWLWELVNTYSAQFTISGGIGTSAGNDWNAGKTITTPDFQAVVPMMPGTQSINSRTKGRLTALNEIFEDRFQGHQHITSFLNGFYPNSPDEDSAVKAFPGNSGNFKTTQIGTDEVNGTPRTGAYNEPNIVGVNYLIKL